MGRYTDYSYDQRDMIPVSYERKTLHGGFDYSLTCLFDHQLELSTLDRHYGDDDNGHSACATSLSLEMTILADSKGSAGSRRFERLRRDTIFAMTPSADTHPHFTTLADVALRSPEASTTLFSRMSQEVFAIDACTPLSHASKEWSGTYAELRKKRQKVHRAARRMLQRHRRVTTGHPRAVETQDRRSAEPIDGWGWRKAPGGKRSV